ncbi:MAG: leucine--tRNA ligase, partial [Acidobacteria bacterium]|nr:leucine--tRNA ligase [Acidobacteriota bacterium]
TDRIAGRGEKSGVFTGGCAINPATGARIPIWIADYVLLSYGTGAIMGVPGHDQRDFEFAKQFGLEIRAVVMPPDAWLRDMKVTRGQYAERIAELESAFVGDGQGMQSAGREVSLDGLPTHEAQQAVTGWLERSGIGRAAVKYKLRDWLFSRQRYWGEPIPVLHRVGPDGEPAGITVAVPESELPVLLPELEDFKPTGRPQGPLEKAAAWREVVRDGIRYLRETNTMPQWAGSCWYYLRFCDPGNRDAAWDPAKERYWMPVDLYVGGAEHAVLHLLYARFWHKALFDRGQVSTLEPFRRLINQGMILSITYRTAEGKVVPYTRIRFGDGRATQVETGEELAGETEKMAKSRGNVIPVDVPVRQHGADTTRMYEMFMGPLETTKPWSMQGVEGISRFLNRAWRMIIDEASEEPRLSPKVASAPEPDSLPTDEQLRVLHKTLRAVTADVEALRFNTAISRLMEFVNFFTGQDRRPASCMEKFVLMLAPLAPHVAEELWQALGHASSLAYEPWPEYDEAFTREDVLDLPVQINGRLRSRVVVASSACPKEVEEAALADPKVQSYIKGKAVRKIIVVPQQLVNIVLD